MRFVIPLWATPRDVAIILFYEKYRSPKRVAEVLHYKHGAPVYRCLKKYRAFLVEQEAKCHMAPQEEAKI